MPFTAPIFTMIWSRGIDKVMSMGAIISSPLVAGNVVYVGRADGNLYALR
jgi:outer membrane protein assembly factor BamB